MVNASVHTTSTPTSTACHAPFKVLYRLFLYLSCTPKENVSKHAIAACASPQGWSLTEHYCGCRSRCVTRLVGRLIRVTLRSEGHTCQSWHWRRKLHGADHMEIQSPMSLLSMETHDGRICRFPFFEHQKATEVLSSSHTRGNPAPVVTLAYHSNGCQPFSHSNYLALFPGLYHPMPRSPSDRHDTKRPYNESAINNSQGRPLLIMQVSLYA